MPPSLTHLYTAAGSGNVTTTPTFLHGFIFVDGAADPASIILLRHGSALGAEALKAIVAPTATVVCMFPGPLYFPDGLYLDATYASEPELTLLIS